MLNDKNKETKSLFAGLEQYKNKAKEKDLEKVDKTNLKADGKEDASRNGSENIFISLLENNKTKKEYIAATHYFRKDQLKDLAKFSKQAKKGKNEFMRELMDLVFSQLRQGLDEEDRNIGSDDLNSLNDKEANSDNKDSDNKASDNPFTSLLEVNDTKEDYLRATHYFREDQLEDLDMFTEKSGKAKNEFVRDIVDLVFGELKK